MSSLIRSLALALSVVLVGGSAAAQSPETVPVAPKLEAADSAKGHDRNRRYNGYRQRHRSPRYHNDRLRQVRYGDRGRNYSHYRSTSQCWRENRYGLYRNTPALISVRLCQDRYGRLLEQRGSTRLVHYVGHNPRRRYY
jgi:hypothetical protein